MLALIALIVGTVDLAREHLGPAALAHIPVWSGLVNALIVPPHVLPGPDQPAVLFDPVVEVGIPLAALLLGARPGELGFRRGHRVWRVLALWGVPLLAFVVAFTETTALTAALGFVKNLFQSGFSEEFLWRGAIQTRLSLLVGPTWGLVLSALGFGLWHLGADAPEVHRRLPVR